MRSRRISPRSKQSVGRKFGDREQAAARLRPLRRARVDAGHDGHDPQPRPQRRDRAGTGRLVGRRAIRARLVSPLHPDVLRRRAGDRSRAFRARAARAARAHRREERRGHSGRVAARARGHLQRHRAREARRRLPAGRPRSALGRHRRRVQFLEQPARHHLSQAESDSRRNGAPRSTCSRWSSATWATTAPPASRSRAIRRRARRSSSASTCRTRRARTSWPASARRCRSPSSKSRCPRRTTSSSTSTRNSKSHYRDMQDIEFTIQSRKLYLLQTRTGKRTGFAAVKIACDMVDEESDHAAPRPSSASKRTRSSSCWRPCSTPRKKTKALQGRTSPRHADFPPVPAPPRASIAFNAENAVQHGQGRPGDPGAHRDLAGRHRRHAQRGGDSHHARRPHFARGGRRARHGSSVRRRRRLAARRLRQRRAAQRRTRAAGRRRLAVHRRHRPARSSAANCRRGLPRSCRCCSKNR